MVDRVINRSSNRISYPYAGKDHTGVDLSFSSNEEENKVFAHSSGIVVAVVNKYNRMIGSTGMLSYGNYVDIDHGNGYKSRYAHLKKNSVCVSIGQSVTSDTQIAIIGNSGNTVGPTGRHLHFEIFKNNQRIDPSPYLKNEFTENNSTFITYQSHDNRYGWNPNVRIGTNEYAGNFGCSMDGIYLDRYKMRVHDKIKNEWLPWVINRNDYAGNIGHSIDGVQIEGVAYQVHLTEGRWLSWIYKCDETPEGYAGIYGKTIDAIQIKPL